MIAGSWIDRFYGKDWHGAALEAGLQEGRMQRLLGRLETCGKLLARLEPDMLPADFDGNFAEFALRSLEVELASIEIGRLPPEKRQNFDEGWEALQFTADERRRINSVALMGDDAAPPQEEVSPAIIFRI